MFDGWPLRPLTLCERQQAAFLMLVYLSALEPDLPFVVAASLQRFTFGSTPLFTVEFAS